MRFTILLALCVLGVASAHSLNKRGLAEDLQAQSQNAFKAFQDFSEQAKQNAEQALKNLMGFFEQFNKKPEAAAPAEAESEVVVEKRDLIEELKARNPDALKTFNELREKAIHEAQEALKNAMKFFNNMSQQLGLPGAPAASEEKTVEKRDLIEELKARNPDALKTFNELREKAIHEAQEALKNAMKFFNNMSQQLGLPGAPAPSEEKTVEKRDLIEELKARNPDALKTFNELREKAIHEAQEALKNAMKFFNNMSQQLGLPGAPAPSEEKTVEKRDLAENLQKLTGQAKENFEKNLKALQDFFAQFNKQPSQAPVEAESEAQTVTKRQADNGLPKLGNVTAGSLFSNIFNPEKFAEQLTTVLINAMAGRNKRDLAENLQKLTGQAKENFDKNLKALMDFFAQFNKQASEAAAPVEAESEVVVEKRENNPMEIFEKFIKDAQSKAQNAGAEFQKAFEQFLGQFQKKPEAPKEASEEVAAPAA